MKKKFSNRIIGGLYLISVIAGIVSAITIAFVAHEVLSTTLNNLMATSNFGFGSPSLQAIDFLRSAFLFIPFVDLFDTCYPYDFAITILLVCLSTTIITLGIMGSKSAKWNSKFLQMIGITILVLVLGMAINFAFSPPDGNVKALLLMLALIVAGLVVSLKLLQKKILRKAQPKGDPDQ